MNSNNLTDFIWQGNQNTPRKGFEIQRRVSGDNQSQEDIIHMNTSEVQGTLTLKAFTYNIGTRVLYRGDMYREEATIIALDCDKLGVQMALLRPTNGSFPMWRALSYCKRIAATQEVAA